MNPDVEKLFSSIAMLVEFMVHRVSVRQESIILYLLTEDFSLIPFMYVRY